MPGPIRPSFLTQPTGALAPVGIDRARRLAWSDVLRTDINQKVGPAADPTHSHWIHKFSLGNQFGLFFGRIVDSIAYVNCYKVQVERGTTTLWCTAGTATGLQPIGARQLGQIPIGSQVLFALHPTDNSGIILCVIPDAQTNSQSALVDFISQCSRSGLLVDEAHHFAITQSLASLITDWSAGRPFDATTEGEFGQITETGLLRFLDSFMTLSRVNEMCGVWHFHSDDLTRIAGHNFQVWTAGSEREDVDDEGEVDIVQGFTPYYWEALGALEIDVNTCREIPANCWQKDPDLQGYSGQEPCNDYQQPFFRLRDFYGYLGQAHKRIVCLPPQECSSMAFPELHRNYDLAVSSQCPDLEDCATAGLNLMHDRLIYPGVYEEDLALTGRLAIRSAHEIIFSKHLLIPGPKQITLPQDPNGDNKDDYKAAGILGSGEEHKVVGNIDIPDTTDDVTQIRALGFLDTHAFVFNWIGDHPFHYHQKDWYLPDESELNYLSRDCNTVAFTVPYFDELKCYHFLEAPPAIPLKVDHRYNKVHYYPNHSYFALLADGGIVLGDGFGAEFKIANGHFWLTAPGDGNIHVGRNIVQFAGYDFVARAKNSWDISATNKDGRLKARNNLWMVASGETGGILLESRSSGVYVNDDTGERAVLGGITIKAPESLVQLCGKNMSLKLTDENQENVLVFDTGWEGRIKFKAKHFERFLSSNGSALDWWVSPGGDCDGTVERGVEWWKDGVLICAPVVIDDKLLVSDCGIFHKNIVSTTGHIVTDKARETQGKVGVLLSNNLEDQFNRIRTRGTTTLPSIGQQELATLCARQDAFTLCDQEFTFRSVQDYRTQHFVLFESRWQQLARITGENVNIWQEEPVNETYPYPGKEKHLGATFRTMDLKLYDGTTLVAADRGAEYEAPEFSEPDKVILDENYLVII